MVGVNLVDHRREFHSEGAEIEPPQPCRPLPDTQCPVVILEFFVDDCPPAAAVTVTMTVTVTVAATVIED